MNSRDRNRSQASSLPFFEPEPAVLADFKRLSTSLICDAIDALKLRGGCMEMCVRPMWPGARFAGVAATSEFVPSTKSGKRDMQDLLALLGQLPAERAMVIGMSGLCLSAGLGYLTSRVARQLGCAGAVVDGPVRDVEAIKALGFPVFARGCVASSSRGRMSLSTTQQPVTCGATLVFPGDVIVGDESGVAVVPREHIPEVLAEAKNQAGARLLWQEQLDNGLHPMEFIRRRMETQR